MPFFSLFNIRYVAFPIREGWFILKINTFFFELFLALISFLEYHFFNLLFHEVCWVTNGQLSGWLWLAIASLSPWAALKPMRDTNCCSLNEASADLGIVESTKKIAREHSISLACLTLYSKFVWSRDIVQNSFAWIQVLIAMRRVSQI